MKTTVMPARHPLFSACLNRWSRTKVADTTSGSGEPSDQVCKIADAAAGFRSDVWEHFGFAVSRNE